MATAAVAAVPSSRFSSLLPCPGVPLPAKFDSLPVLTRPQIAAKIASGQLLVVHTPLVYRIPPAWLNIHPGGDLAILHYVGRDASNEIEAYHTGRTVAERMARWVIGKVEVGEDGWRDMVPPVQLGMWPIPVPKITLTLHGDEKEGVVEKVKEEELKEKEPLLEKGDAEGSWLLNPAMVDPPCAPYEDLPLTPSYQNHLRQSLRGLHTRIQSLGLDTPPPYLSGYAPSLVIYVGLAILAAYLYHRARTTFDYILAAVALGGFWHQVTFVAHDAGHTGLTGDWYGDRVRGLLIANFMGGMSIGWWADNHNVHHRTSCRRRIAVAEADSPLRSGDQLA